MQPTRASTVTSRQQARIGKHALSKDERAAVKTLNDAAAGNIPAVRKVVRQLRKSGKGVEETLAAVKHPLYRDRGPLHLAAWAGRLEMCKFLVEELRLNVNAPGQDGAMPLSYAIYGCGSTSVVRFLLDSGAKPNKANKNGVTALHYAAMPGTCTNSKSTKSWAANTRDACEIADLLLSRGAYIDPICLSGTPLHIAARNGNVKMLELLLRHQANAMEINPDDSTLYAKRSLSWMCMSEQDKALDDAYTYRTMKMDLSNSCCEQAAALILVKEYARACRALVSALKLDLRSDDLD